MNADNLTVELIPNKGEDSYHLPEGYAIIVCRLADGHDYSKKQAYDEYRVSNSPYWWEYNIYYYTKDSFCSVNMDQFTDCNIPITGEHLSDEWWVGRHKRDQVWEDHRNKAIEYCKQNGLIPVIQ